MTDEDLSHNARALYLKAKHANDIGNHGYVIQLMQAVLKEAPGFLDGRKLLRAAALSQNKGKKAGFSIASTTLGITSGGMLKKDPLAAMELAEKTLATDPQNSGANQLLFEAANKAGFPLVAAYALETLVGANPKDTKVMHQLGNHYLAIMEHEKAVAVFSKIAQINPGDLEAIKKSKDASAASTMRKGKWEEVSQSGGAMNFRDLIGKVDEAISLEQKGKIVRTVDQISQQAAETYALWESQQTNVDLSKRLASLYDQWFEAIIANDGPADEADQQLDTAIWYYGHTNELLTGGDPNIARKLSDLQLKKKERRIKVLEDWLGGVEDKTHPEVLPYVDELSTLVQDRDSGLLSVAKKRVEDNPTDLQLRYELGEVLMRFGNYKDAIPELQRARQNPNVRLKAMNLLGECFDRRGMLDLAVSQLKGAAGEILAMDSLKKEILYRLAMVHEKMGKKDDYIDCLKQIYEADYGYKDVATRVENSYEAPG